MNALVLYTLLSLPLVGTYALLGLGITVTYQASRVINLAHGAVAMSAAYITYQLNLSRLFLPGAAGRALTSAHLVLPLAVLGGIGGAVLLGVAIERVFVRGLRSAGPTAQTVGTVAVFTLLVVVATRIWGSLPVPTTPVLPTGNLVLRGGFVPWDKLLIFPVSLIGAGLLFALFKFTSLGLAMRGAAQNRRGAALRGIDPDRTSTMAWVIGGGLAGLAGILLAGSGELDPYFFPLSTLPAFIAALIGGLESMPGAVAGAAVIGLVEGLVPALSLIPVFSGILGAQGAPALVLGLVAIIVMALRGQRLVAGDVRQTTL
ncbi:MAG: branched-chain amino acid ABC transporter permease [Candidatus Dormibacteria bacterium]